MRIAPSHSSIQGSGKINGETSLSRKMCKSNSFSQRNSLVYQITYFNNMIVRIVNHTLSSCGQKLIYGNTALECRSYLGLFPEINRVWVTIDHRLFLWNYEDPNRFVGGPLRIQLDFST